MAKQLVVSVTLAVVLLSLSPAHSQADVLLLGKGIGSSCGTWTKERKTQDWLFAGDWVLGFMSGAASALNRDLLLGLDSNAVLGWVDNYCRAHPLDKVAEAATRLLELRVNGK
jgi:hypothetical protein